MFFIFLFKKISDSFIKYGNKFTALISILIDNVNLINVLLAFFKIIKNIFQILILICILIAAFFLFVFQLKKYLDKPLKYLINLIFETVKVLILFLFKLQKIAFRYFHHFLTTKFSSSNVIANDRNKEIGTISTNEIETVNVQLTHFNFVKTRKKREPINDNQYKVLFEYYTNIKYPSRFIISDLVIKTDLNYNQIKYWFSYQRKKDAKKNKKMNT